MLVLTSFASAAPATPFKGSWDSAENTTIDFPGGIPTMHVDGLAWGNATHLGEYSATFQATVNLIEGCSVGDTAEFTAADGATLTGLGNGCGTPDAPGYHHVIQTYEITGGTGRLAGASGTFTVDRWANDATGVSHGSFDGTLAVPSGK
jgi:hypothetical protein